MAAFNLLYQLYKDKVQPDRALKYHKIYEANHSAKSITQAQKVEDLLAMEKERQREIVEKSERKKNARKHNLQYAAIAFAILSL